MIQSQHIYELYSIGNASNRYRIQKTFLNKLFDGDASFRKAVASPYKVNQSKHLFTDDTFRFNITKDDTNQKGQKLQIRRIYQIYDNELDMFSRELMEDIPLKKQPFYPTFISEFSMIDKNYIQTRFFTKKINGRGYYMYFVRRNGEYHVEFIDDLIPVDPQTKMPPWGMSQRQPWKLVLMKAWLKEKKTISALISAQPFQFIQAFGFPGYRALAIQKQINYLAVSNMKAQNKMEKEKKIPLDVPGFMVVGKTRNNQKISDLGLVPNRAGYRLFKTNFDNKSVVTSQVRGGHVGSNKQIDKKGDDNLYKIHSSLPSYWVGEFSVFAKSKAQDERYKVLLKEFKSVHNQFLASYYQISRLFSKFYLCPEYDSDKFKGNVLEDSLSVDAGNGQNIYYFQFKVRSNGFLNLNIELPLQSADYMIAEGKSAPRYSYIKYLMAKKRSQQNRDMLVGYSFYDGEYVKGYHKSCNRFVQIQKGDYYIYFKVQKNKQLRPSHKIAININTNARVQSFKEVDYRNPKYDFDFVMKSALYNYSRRVGTKCLVGKSKQDKNLCLVHVAHKFDQIGFGLISMTTMEKSSTFLAVNVFRDVLQQNKMDFCKQLHQYGEDEKVINIATKEKEANILVLERTIKSRQIDELFPPEGAIDFYNIM